MAAVFAFLGMLLISMLVALLTALQQREEFYLVIGQCDFSGHVAAI